MLRREHIQTHKEACIQSYINTHAYSGEVELTFHVTPSTGDDKGKQYVCLDLHAVLSSGVSSCNIHCPVVVISTVP